MSTPHRAPTVVCLPPTRSYAPVQVALQSSKKGSITSKQPPCTTSCPSVQQAPPMQSGLPSVQAAPWGASDSTVHWPVAGSQDPATWHSSLGTPQSTSSQHWRHMPSAQGRVPAGQTQEPRAQIRPPVQTTPHAPQLNGSVRDAVARSTQLAPQRSVPLGQGQRSPTRDRPVVRQTQPNPRRYTSSGAHACAPPTRTAANPAMPPSRLPT